MANDTTNKNPLILDTTAATYDLAQTIVVHTAVYSGGTTAGHHATVAQNSHSIIDLTCVGNGSTVVVNFPGGLTISNQDQLAVTITSGILHLYHH